MRLRRLHQPICHSMTSKVLDVLNFGVPYDAIEWQRAGLPIVDRGKCRKTNRQNEGDQAEYTTPLKCRVDHLLVMRLHHQRRPRKVEARRTRVAPWQHSLEGVRSGAQVAPAPRTDGATATERNINAAELTTTAHPTSQNNLGRHMAARARQAPPRLASESPALRSACAQSLQKASGIARQPQVLRKPRP